MDGMDFTVLGLKVAFESGLRILVIVGDNVGEESHILSYRTISKS